MVVVCFGPRNFQGASKGFRGGGQWKASTGSIDPFWPERRGGKSPGKFRLFPRRPVRPGRAVMDADAHRVGHDQPETIAKKRRATAGPVAGGQGGRQGG